MSGDDFPILDLYACAGTPDDLRAILLDKRNWSEHELWSALDAALMRAHYEHIKILLRCKAPTHRLTPSAIQKYTDIWARSDVSPKEATKTLAVLRSYTVKTDAK